MSASRSPSARCRPEMLTAIRRWQSGSRRFHSASRSQAWVSTHRSISKISDERSAIGMKSPGMTIP